MWCNFSSLLPTPNNRTILPNSIAAGAAHNECCICFSLSFASPTLCFYGSDRFQFVIDLTKPIELSTISGIRREKIALCSRYRMIVLTLYTLFMDQFIRIWAKKSVCDCWAFIVWCLMYVYKHAQSVLYLFCSIANICIRSSQVAYAVLNNRLFIIIVD